MKTKSIFKKAISFVLIFTIMISFSSTLVKADSISEDNYYKTTYILNLNYSWNSNSNKNY